MQQVDFYLISNLVGDGQLKLASRLSNKIQRLEQRALIITQDEAQLNSLDEIMWTFNDTSFVAHDRYSLKNVDQADTSHRANICLIQFSDQNLSASIDQFDVLINLANVLPSQISGHKRIAEIVDADENSKVMAREKFKDYRVLGITPKTHNIQL